MIKDREAYNPVPIYNRKLCRTIIRSRLAKHGFGANKKLGEVFHGYREMLLGGKN